MRSFLLRYGRRYPVPRGRWGVRYELWLQTQSFEEPAAQAAFDHLVGAASVRAAQLQAIDRQVEDAALSGPLAGPVACLRAFRGIDTLTALTIITETCDFARFPAAAGYMAFTGLVPREHSSGASRRQGSITKAGNAHLRRVLIEAAWAYRHRPAVRGKLAVRQQGLPPELARLLLEGAAAAPRDLREAGRAARCEQGGGRGRARALRLRLGGDDRAHGHHLKERGAMRAGGEMRPRSDPRVRYAQPIKGMRVPSGRQAPVRPQDVRSRSADISMVERRTHVPPARSVPRGAQALSTPA